MAGVERFELPTRGFGIRCSANWSYTPKIGFKLFEIGLGGFKLPTRAYLHGLGESAALLIGATPLWNLENCRFEKTSR